MAGGRVKYRHLSRNSAHRRSLLRNLVTTLIEKETIHTTWPKAKEAQRMVEKLITLGKRNTDAARRSAMTTLFTPHLHLPKLFGELRERYANRPGGYTRVMRTEPKKEDQAPSAILELVDGPKDMKFHMTAATLVRMREMEKEKKALPKPMVLRTSENVEKVTQFRPEGRTELKGLVERLEDMKLKGLRGWRPSTKKKTYPLGRDGTFYQDKEEMKYAGI